MEFLEKERWISLSIAIDVVATSLDKSAEKMRHLAEAHGWAFKAAETKFIAKKWGKNL